MCNSGDTKFVAGKIGNAATRFPLIETLALLAIPVLPVEVEAHLVSV